MKYTALILIELDAPEGADLRGVQTFLVRMGQQMAHREPHGTDGVTVGAVATDILPLPADAFVDAFRATGDTLKARVEANG